MLHHFCIACAVSCLKTTYKVFALLKSKREADTERQRMKSGAISLDILMTCVWLWLPEWGWTLTFETPLVQESRTDYSVCVFVCVCALSSYDELQLGTLDLLQTLFYRIQTMTTELNLIRHGFMFSVSLGALCQLSPMFVYACPCVCMQACG